MYEFWMVGRLLQLLFRNFGSLWLTGREETVQGVANEEGVFSVSGMLGTLAGHFLKQGGPVRCRFPVRLLYGSCLGKRVLLRQEFSQCSFSSAHSWEWEQGLLMDCGEFVCQLSSYLILTSILPLPVI